MPGLVPGIHVLDCLAIKTWMAETSPAMTPERIGMHDIKWIREHKEEFDRGLVRRGLPPEADKLLAIDERWRAAIQRIESAQAQRNAMSREAGAAKKSNEEEVAQKLMSEVAQLRNAIAAMEVEERKFAKDLVDALAEIPNLLLDDVPDGKDASSNVKCHHFGVKRDFKNEGFTPKQHFELGEALGQMDFERAAKLSGARFVVLESGLAGLERALAQFMLDLHTKEHNYTEVNPPLLVRNDVMFGTAQLPKFAEDQFSTINKGELIEVADNLISKSITETVDRLPAILTEIEKETGHAVDLAYALKRLKEVIVADLPAYKRELILSLSELLRLWLIPTGEVPLTNLVRESIVDEATLPMRFTACTPCFRAEAGAAGKDTRGMIRQHQFDKVELVSITTPEQSKNEHERMLACAEEVLRRLDLHYRVMMLCAGDTGFAAQKTYDIEVWLPGENQYREISSCSLCGEFQARRMIARCRNMKSRQVRYVHTLNGSGVAVGRALIAVMETYQQQGGSIAVPEVLQSYMGDLKTIERTR